MVQNQSNTNSVLRQRHLIAPFCSAVFLLLLIGSVFQSVEATEQDFNPELVPELFLELLADDVEEQSVSLAKISQHWQSSMLPMAIEILRFSRSRKVNRELVKLLAAKTGKDYDYNLNHWYEWLWSKPEQRHPHYSAFKSLLYREIDPRFAEYFDNNRQTTVRLDEVRWGGVKQDGIPPLREPNMVDANSAAYLADSDVVFGVVINGDARAYPKRILAWHEMFVDTIGGTEFAGVYCTLCGAVILYETRHEDILHEVGTSGFLFRSNKVMYDKKTRSLWNTTRGEPIVGPLVGKGIQLKRSFLVTTTWGEWRKRHPETTVLSLKTGYKRNYDEGEAYRNYFATDELMFTVPKKDNRLANKAEVLALYFPEISDSTLAISADFLSTKPVYQHSLGPQALVVFTDGSGANRVYDASGIIFTSYDGKKTATDESGGKWTLEESELLGVDGKTQPRLAAHRAFWFGWYATFNDTELVY